MGNTNDNHQNDHKDDRKHKICRNGIHTHLQAKNPLEFELTISNEHFTLHKATRLALNPSKC